MTISFYEKIDNALADLWLIISFDFLNENHGLYTRMGSFNFFKTAILNPNDCIDNF
jgi:hypothetical protein